MIENDEDEFIVIPSSLRRSEDDESSTTPLTSEESISDENEEEERKSSLYATEQRDNEKSLKGPTPKLLENLLPTSRSTSRIRRIDDDEDDDDEDENNVIFDHENETPIYQHYYETNALQEEATTTGSKQISIGSLKRQFDVNTDQSNNVPFLPSKTLDSKHRKSSSGGSNDEGMVMDGDRSSTSSGSSNKSLRSRDTITTSSSNKSLKKMEDEFADEEPFRTVSRKSIVSRNSIIFAESLLAEEENSNNLFRSEDMKLTKNDTEMDGNSTILNGSIQNCNYDTTAINDNLGK